MTTAQSTAHGGNGGQGRAPQDPSSHYEKGGDGAAAMATARGSSSGGDVQVYAYQFGGNGGNTGDQNSISGSTGGNGADSIMPTAVFGSTTGVLTLGQYAYGGNGGNSWYGSGGMGGKASSTLSANNAESSLLNTRTNAIGGIGGDSIDGTVSGSGGDAIASNTTDSHGDDHNIKAVSYAEGGRGGNPVLFSLPGAGGNSTSQTSVTANGNSAVQAEDKAVGGNGSYDGNHQVYSGKGGSASSHASASNSGNRDVSVSSTAIGGAGGFAPKSSGGTSSARASGWSNGGGNVTVTAHQYGGTGVDSNMLNAVTGSTSGVLTLEQYAYGGDGGGSTEPGAIHGNGGKASSILSVTNTDSKVLNTTTVAIGGTAGIVRGGSHDRGGDAIARNDTTSIGDGHSIYVNSNAEGGRNGKGGNATSSANGIAIGNSNVHVSDKATGGSGEYLYFDSIANNGGAAVSNANASNSGTQSVYASSNATGGAGGFTDYNTQGLAGDAQAHTKATSTAGFASSSAIATAGKGSALANLVTADATSVGGNGSYANALAGQSAYASVSAAARVPNTVAGTSDVKAALGQPAPVTASANDKQAVAYATALPLSTDVTAALANHTNVYRDFNADSDAQAWLLGKQGVLNTAVDDNFHDYSSKIDLIINTAGYTNQQDLLLGLLSPALGGSNLGVNDTLTFNIMVSGAGGTLSKSYSFSDLLDINAPGSGANFFHDKILDLGAWSEFVTATNANLDIALSLNLHTQTSNTGLSFNYILGNSLVSAVPVPAAFWLFGSACLGWIGFNRRKYATV